MVSFLQMLRLLALFCLGSFSIYLPLVGWWAGRGRKSRRVTVELLKRTACMVSYLPSKHV